MAVAVSLGPAALPLHLLRLGIPDTETTAAVSMAVAATVAAGRTATATQRDLDIRDGTEISRGGAVGSLTVVGPGPS